jgi:putative phosphoribosyl transferase
VPFRDRADAGRRLAELLAPLRDEDVVVAGLPRGGVPVAAEVAAALEKPLDVVVVRKLGVPMQPELGMGAIGEEDVIALNEALIAEVGLTADQVSRVAASERQELERRVRAYRGDRPPVPMEGRTGVLVDDGLATGYTARAAVSVARRRQAERVVLAVPVAPPEAVRELEEVADDVVAVEMPMFMAAVGSWYENFDQTSDREVVALLATA